MAVDVSYLAPLGIAAGLEMGCYIVKFVGTDKDMSFKNKFERVCYYALPTPIDLIFRKDLFEKEGL